MLLYCTLLLCVAHEEVTVTYISPPSLSAFVHRCGRTARIGNQGNALVFLLPMEESYVNFLSINQKVRFVG